MLISIDSTPPALLMQPLNESSESFHDFSTCELDVMEVDSSGMEDPVHTSSPVLPVRPPTTPLLRLRVRDEAAASGTGNLPVNRHLNSDGESAGIGNAGSSGTINRMVSTRPAIAGPSRINNYNINSVADHGSSNGKLHLLKLFLGIIGSCSLFSGVAIDISNVAAVVNAVDAANQGIASSANNGFGAAGIINTQSVAVTSEDRGGNTGSVANNVNDNGNNTNN